MKKEIEKCKYCGQELKPLNPPIEEYAEYKFIIKFPFTDWKFMLFRDNFEYGCLDCLAEKQKDNRQENDREIYYAGIEEGYNKAMEERENY